MAVTRTPTVANPGTIQVAVSTGQFLHFIVDAVGPVPIFSFAGVKGVLFEAPDFPGHPTTRYEWLHLKNPSDFQQLELLDIRFSFLTNSDYTYTVELRDSAGTLVGTMIQIKYNGAPTDTASESFTVVLS
jgi:hypothetical protein